jgi:8-oxo-dGTP pyrophosphatase MutT (NUDIX family)
VKYVSIKIFWAIVQPIRIAYWYIVRPHTRGAKCVVERRDGAVLLVRLNYGHKRWTFPGGGVGRREEPMHAAIRELKEETGLVVAQVVPLFRYTQAVQYKQDTVDVFYVRVEDYEIKKKMDVEIAEVRWFLKEALPEHRVSRVDEIVARMRHASV